MELPNFDKNFDEILIKVRSGFIDLDNNWGIIRSTRCQKFMSIVTPPLTLAQVDVF